MEKNIDWKKWMERWDAQQQAYIPYREELFTTMLDIVQAVTPSKINALDIACGPGSISQRLLTRFPDATSLAVDLDPVLIEMGKNVLGDFSGRLHWKLQDVTEQGWTQSLAGTFTVALSATALHWLNPNELLQTYKEIYAVLAPGGILLNGDYAFYGSHFKTINAALNAVDDARQHQMFDVEKKENFDQWWASLKKEPEITDLLAERTKLFSEKHSHSKALIREMHIAALEEAGFVEAAVVWQDVSTLLIMAVK